MRFGISQNEKFKSRQGAYSVITQREIVDSQITLTDFEAELVVTFFGRDNIHTGKVESNRALAAKVFTLYPSAKEIILNLVFPKTGKNELRLYLSKKAGFKPEAGEIWFLYIKDERIWIGSMNALVWRSEMLEQWEDECEKFFQYEIEEQDRAKIYRLRERDIHARDRKIALKRLEIAGYTCEYDNSHRLFKSRSNNRPYLEVHHLIPLNAQKYFKKSLDKLANVCCLCPFCHSAVHFAENELASKILIKLIAERPIERIYSLADGNDILGFYGLEKIMKG